MTLFRTREKVDSQGISPSVSQPQRRRNVGLVAAILSVPAMSSAPAAVGPTQADSKVTTRWQSPRLEPSEQREILTPAQALSKVDERVGVIEDLADAPGFRITVAKGGDVNQSYLRWLLPSPVAKRDGLTLKFEARSPDGDGEVNLRVGSTRTPSKALIDRTMRVGSQWREQVVFWTADDGDIAGETDIRLRFGTATQTLELRGVTVLSQGAGEVGWVATAGEQWRAIDLRDPDVQPGSALDFSAWWDGQPAGAHGRVVINSEGRLAFADDPTQRVVFFGASANMGPGGGFALRNDIATIDGENLHTPITHKDIAAFANRMRNHGYNLFRPHFLDAA